MQLEFEEDDDDEEDSFISRVSATPELKNFFKKNVKK